MRNYAVEYAPGAITVSMNDIFTLISDYKFLLMLYLTSVGEGILDISNYDF
jgi:hypothetical protein